MNYNNIPNEMKTLNQWACFRTQWSIEEKKFKKIIISPKTGKFAYCNNPETWATFPEAKEFCQKFKYQGLVFALTSGITFIDIDHAIDKATGEIVSKEAKELLELLPNTFTERSVSGTGIHILMLGNLPENALKRNDSKGLEMYDTKRFICMTGDTLNEHIELADYSDKIEKINLNFIGKRQERVYRETPFLQTDDELIERIKNSKQGAKFQSLYQGNTSGYVSASNADFALASILAWWTQDFGQIDRIFRTSGLMREKWDRRCGNSTYGANLIDSVLGISNHQTSHSTSGIVM